MVKLSLRHAVRFPSFHKVLFSLSLAVVPLLWPAGVARAADVTWQGVDNVWATGTNWSTGAMPGSGDRVIFGAPGASLAVSNGGDRTIGGMYFTGAANYTVTINTQVIYLGNQGIEVAGGIQTITSGNLRLNQSGATTILNNGTLTINSGIMYHRTVAPVGDKVLTFDGTGTTTVSNFQRRSSDYNMSLVKNGTGTLVISGEVTTAAQQNAAGFITGTVTINAGKIRISTEGALGGDPAAFNAGQLTLNGGALNAAASFTIDDSNRGVTLGASGGTFEVDANMTLTVANVITGAGGLTKTGNGTLILTGTNDYAGTTSVNTGILSVRNSSGLGTVVGGTTVASGATLQLQGDITIGAEALTLSGTGFTGQSGALVNVSGNNSLGGQITLGANTTIASLAGTLNLTSTAAVVGGGRTLTLTGAGSGTFAGAMDTTVASLTKAGTGTWTLTGANTYTGATAVNAGTLNLADGGSLGATAVTVQSGATLAGTGTIGGAVNLISGSTLSVGDARVAGSTGVLSIGGGLTLGAQTVLDYDLGTSSDRVAVTGNLLLNGVLQIKSGSVVNPGETYTLMTYTGTLTNLNLTVANQQAGYNYVVTAAAGQVNLVLNQTGLQFWDGSNTTANGTVDGGAGLWTNSSANTNWTNGTGSTNAGWTVGQTAVFLGTAGEVQVGDTVVVGGLQFGSGYTLTDAGGGVGRISVSGAATEVRVSGSAEATIEVPIVGAGGINKTGTGTLAVEGSSSYAGATVVSEGTLKLGTSNALPTGTALTVGSDGLVANLDASSASQSVASLQVASNSTGTSTVTIGAGQTLSVTGAGGFKVGVANTFKVRTNATFTGGGSLVVDNSSATFEVGLQTATVIGPGSESPTQADVTGNSNATVVNMTGLASVNVNVSTFRVAHGLNNGATLSLSNTANTITANSFQISHSAGWNAGSGLVYLGSGTNVILTDSLEIGISKGGGTLRFLQQTAGSAGTVEIRGKSGEKTNIVLGSTQGTVTGAAPSGTLDLRGHVATVNASLVSAGKRDTTSAGATGIIYFDGGTFNADIVELGSMSGESSGTAAGTLNVSNGVFTVNSGGAFVLATFNNSQPAIGRAQGTVNITGGTLISNVDIQEGGGLNSTTTNTVSTINLDGGTLDMTGHNIGSASNTINTLTLASGTLKDTGEINGGAAISKTTAGTLAMQGNNAYTGATTVSAGSMLVTNDYTSAASATGSNTVTVSNTATFGGNGRVAGPVTLNNGATLAPGGNATTATRGVTGLTTVIGTLRIDNTLTASSGSNMAMQLQTGGAHGLNATFNATTGMLTSVSGTSLDGGNDRIIVNGNIVLNASSKITVTLAPGYTPSKGSVFDLLDWVTINGGSTILDAYFNFAGNGRRTGADNLAYGLILPDLTIYGSDYFWDVSQFGSTGVIAVVPEPGRAMLLLVGAMGMVLRRRRRKCVGV